MAPAHGNLYDHICFETMARPTGRCCAINRSPHRRAEPLEQGAADADMARDAARRRELANAGAPVAAASRRLRVRTATRPRMSVALCAAGFIEARLQTIVGTCASTSMTCRPILTCCSFCLGLGRSSPSCPTQRRSFCSFGGLDPLLAATSRRNRLGTLTCCTLPFDGLLCRVGSASPSCSCGRHAYRR